MSPSPDQDWALNLETELMRDTTDDDVPGGLRPMAKDALAYTDAQRHTPYLTGYLDNPSPSVYCAHLARHAGDIAEKFPTTDDLAELMADQSAFLHRAIDTRYGTPPAPRREARHNSTVICALLAQRGVDVTRELLRKWAERGKITAERAADGRNGYLLSEVVLAGANGLRWIEKRIH